MTKNTSLFPLRAIRYGVGYTERYFKFAWSQTGWVWNQSQKYLTWVKRQHIHLGFRVAMYVILIGFPLLWASIILWGFIRSI